MMVRVFTTVPTKRFFVMVLGNTFDSHKTFMDHLTISPNLREVAFVKDCDVVIAFVPIVSRAGTDIAAAMEKFPPDKPVVLVTLHPTFDPDYIAPDSRYCVKNDKVFAVDCLFYEDLGLLKCRCNDDAIKAVKDHLMIKEVDRNTMLKRTILIIGFCFIMVCICAGYLWGGLLGGIVTILMIVYWVKA